jgi:hypothetical protein
VAVTRSEQLLAACQLVNRAEQANRGRLVSGVTPPGDGRHPVFRHDGIVNVSPFLGTGPSARTYRGTYGFRLDGAPGAASLLVEAPPDWPLLQVAWRRLIGEGPREDRVSEDRIELVLRTGGWVEIERVEPRAVFHLPAPLDDGALVHPYLAPVAALAARWFGRESFHAGAVVLRGGAWALVGDKGAGKSSTLAHLSLSGYDIVTDDMLILDEGRALAGPRCLDLRAETAGRLDLGTPLGVVGDRERWRMKLGPLVPSVPLRGWVVLGWDDRTQVSAIHGAGRLALLGRHRAVRLESTRPEVLLELSSLPVLELRRPHRWDALPEAAERLLDAVAD